MTAHARISYPRKVAIKRAIEAARAGGLEPAGYYISPDGTIHVYTSAGAPRGSLFDELEASGKL